MADLPFNSRILGATVRDFDPNVGNESFSPSFDMPIPATINANAYLRSFGRPKGLFWERHNLSDHCLVRKSMGFKPE